MNHREKYDLLVVDSFAKFGNSVNELMECIEKVRMPIYSLKEGLLYIDGEKRTIQSNTVQQGINGS